MNETINEVTRSGYTPCACRDCMDVTVSADTSAPELCSACEDAGCEPYPNRFEMRLGDPFECQRDDAYGMEPETAPAGCPEPAFHHNPTHFCDADNPCGHHCKPGLANTCQHCDGTCEKGE